MQLIATHRKHLSAVTLALAGLFVVGFGLHAASAAPPAFKPRSVKAKVQLRPGGPRVDQEMKVHEAPVDLPTVSADAAPLEDDDLVLGVVVDGKAMAFPIRFLAMSEVINARVGNTPLAPTW